MKTRIVTLKNNDKTIKLVGVSHIGTEEYYKNIIEYLIGDVILYERIKDSKDLTMISPFQQKIASLLNLRTQNECINYDNGNFYNSDITYKVLKECVSESFLNEIDEALDIIIKYPRLFKFILIIILKHLIPFMEMFRKQDFAIIEFRNNIVINDALNMFTIEDSKVKNITILYGEGHIDHFIKCFNSIGYKILKKDKLNMFMKTRSK